MTIETIDLTLTPDRSGWSTQEQADYRKGGESGYAATFDEWTPAYLWGYVQGLIEAAEAHIAGIAG